MPLACKHICNQGDLEIFHIFVMCGHAINKARAHVWKVLSSKVALQKHVHAERIFS